MSAPDRKPLTARQVFWFYLAFSLLSFAAGGLIGAGLALLFSAR